jgi:DNA topoisomerase-2
MSASASVSTSAQDAQLKLTYQIKTDKQHVLDNPDTYTGSMEPTEYDTYIFTNDETIKAEQITIIPGLYKLFDEGIVNCRDHCVRMAHRVITDAATTYPVTEIDVDITSEGVITMTNDGNGIDVAMHPVENIWIPELIFGHLRTSTNYDKDQKKTTGGKNGLGFKLVLLWSTWGKIETIDHGRGLKYTQEFTDNLNTIHPPRILKCSLNKKPYTTVSFKPDYKRLGLPGGLSPDMLALFKRRVYDIASITDKSVKVKFNGQVVPVRNFLQYVDLYQIPSEVVPHASKTYVHEHGDPRWEYAVALAPAGEFTQVSFVNGIFTGKGGKHVDYIMAQIVKKLTLYIKTKRKVDIKANLKSLLRLYLRCEIENPTFDSQTKDYMTTPSANFGSACEVSDKFIEKLAKLGVMDAACALTEVKELKAVKKNDGSKSRNIRGIPKLIDANDAGGPQSDTCMLILCEGDSAKAGIVSGLSAADRQKIGVYPLRGKLFNVRGETSKRIREVKEIHEIQQIMGLQAGKVYTAEEKQKLLRYGKLVLMTDQDLDGSHIKGLIINLFDSEWPSLLALPGFLSFMNTPIIKAQKGTQIKLFYNDGEYNQWKTNSAMLNGWHIKYYKGLGTSTGKEFKEYFVNKKIVDFTSTGPVSHDAVDKAFNKKRANDRKDWLAAYNRQAYLDTLCSPVSYEKFIDEELIHFSQKDCERSIPNFVDGFKTSQRKILYTCFARNLSKTEVKVAQLGGSVSELSRYHHGEQSLYGAIINMAQDFVGSNNINLLQPNGQFGTRLAGGADAASERYICTVLSKLTRYIFCEPDDAVLVRLEDDGALVEPMHYVPILPMLLVNGAKGIGTGFSTDILCYNPLQIIDYLTAKLRKESPGDGPFLPYYHGFQGEISALDSSNVASSTAKFLIKGKYEILSDKQVRITELPIGTWTDDYKQFLEELLEDGKDNKDKDLKDKDLKDKELKDKELKDKDLKEETKPKLAKIKDYVDKSTDTTVDITVTFVLTTTLKEMQSTPAEHGCNALEKLLKLYTTRTTSNMHAFDEHEKLQKFATVSDIIDAFMKVRLHYYGLRKEKQVSDLRGETEICSNKARFITAVLQDELDLRKKSAEEVITLLRSQKYTELPHQVSAQPFDYLRKLPMDSVTTDNVERILKERDNKRALLLEVESKTITETWLEELSLLRAAYLKEITPKSTSPAAKATTAIVKKKVVKKKLE